jgi:hypothetical protein
MGDAPLVNIKDYIVKCRQAGMPDSKIADSLKKANWPQDILDGAFLDSNSILPPVAEPEVASSSVESIVPSQEKPNLDASKKQEEQKKPVDAVSPVVKEKKQFSIFAFISFVLSPIPFLGLALCMTAYDYTVKRKMSGAFFAIFGLIINIAVLGFIIYVMFQIFSMDQNQLTGFSKFVNDNLHLVDV